MANLEIAQIQNAALKAAALEVDESGITDGYIDSSEINIFKDKATALLNEKKCTAQEFATLFATNEVDKTNTTDVFAKVDSLHNAKNTPEALAKEAEEAKRAEKQEKIKEIKAKIAKNDEKLKLYEERLSQQKISEKEFYSEVGESLHVKAMMPGILTAVGGFCTSIGSMVGMGLVSVCDDIFGLYRKSDIASNIYHGLEKSIKGGAVATLASLAIITAGALYHSWKFKSGSEQQNNYRNAYKEAYLKVSQENEQLKAQLAELQK